MSPQSCCPFRRPKAAPSSGGFAMPPTRLAAAATMSTSCPAITATAAPARRSTASAITSFEIPPAIDRGVAGGDAARVVALRRRAARARRDRAGRRASPQPARGSLAEQRRRAAGEAGDLAAQHGIRLGVRVCRWDRRLFNCGFAAATRVLGVSNFIRDHAEQRYPRVPVEVEDRLQRRRWQRCFGPEWRSTDYDPPILYVGRVEERKGVHVLVDAFEQVISKQRPNARLRIVGPHSYWDAKPSPYYQALRRSLRGQSAH